MEKMSFSPLQIIRRVAKGKQIYVKKNTAAEVWFWNQEVSRATIDYVVFCLYPAGLQL